MTDRDDGFEKGRARNDMTDIVDSRAMEKVV